MNGNDLSFCFNFIKKNYRVLIFDNILVKP